MKKMSAIFILRIASLLLLVIPIGQALAADITVDEDCSLGNAILSANEQAMVEPRAECEAGDADDGTLKWMTTASRFPRAWTGSRLMSPARSMVSSRLMQRWPSHPISPLMAAASR